MGEEIPDDEPTPKKCEHGRKNIYIKNVMGTEYVNTTSRSGVVKSLEAHKYVNITSKGRFVKSAEVHKYVDTTGRSIWL